LSITDQKSIYLNNLGCARNLVDGEVMLGILKDKGFRLISDPSQADIIIVNTCSFIESAINESLDEILELAEYKDNGNCMQLIVTGCLPERFREEITDSLPEVDIFLGTGAYHQIAEFLDSQPPENCCMLPLPESAPIQQHDTKRIPAPGPMAYLKVTEGCNRHCTYCIIPQLRGKLRSRTIEDIAAEASHLISQGFKEIVIIGQETGAYGKDLDPPVRLSQLIGRVADISPDIWIRFLYGSPDTTDDELIRTVASHENICSYFDIPIQHSCGNIIKQMGRQYDENDLKHLFDRIRDIVPDASLRTTVMVGFPGETDDDFKQMLHFIETVRFDHLGAFIYSDAEDLPSHHLPNHVPEEIAKQRHHELMTRQAQISAEKNQKHIGSTYRVLVEEKMEDQLYTGRAWFQAPEVDGIVYIDSTGEKDIQTGEFVDVHIKEAFEYDIRGEVV